MNGNFGPAVEADGEQVAEAAVDVESAAIGTNQIRRTCNGDFSPAESAAEGTEACIARRALCPDRIQP